MSSRRNIKRIWRVPRDRGAVEYLSALVVKSLVKHGWPARATPLTYTDGFSVSHMDYPEELPNDFYNALEIAVRILARTYQIDVSVDNGRVLFNRSYRVMTSGQFKEQKE